MGINSSCETTNQNAIHFAQAYTLSIIDSIQSSERLIKHEFQHMYMSSIETIIEHYVLICSVSVYEKQSVQYENCNMELIQQMYDHGMKIMHDFITQQCIKWINLRVQLEILMRSKNYSKSETLLEEIKKMENEIHKICFNLQKWIYFGSIIDQITCSDTVDHKKNDFEELKDHNQFEDPKIQNDNEALKDHTE